MKKRGWALNALQFPSCIHLCVTMVHTKDGVAEPTRPDEPKPEEEEGEPKAKKAKGAAEPAKAKWFEEDEAKTTKESIALFEISGYPILFCPDLHVANTSL